MIGVVILAGGHGKRMSGPIPKVLMPLAGQSLLESVWKAAMAIQPAQILLVVSERVAQHPLGKAILSDISECTGNSYIFQQQPFGTGQAVQEAFPYLRKDLSKVLILHGDVPLIQSETLIHLLEFPHDLTVCAAQMENPEKSSFGRLVLEGSELVKIVETREATPEQKKIKWANAAIYSISYRCLRSCLFALKKQESCQEIYFTDIVHESRLHGFSTTFLEIDPQEAWGGDTLEAFQTAPVQEFLRKKWIKKGVIFQDPHSTVLSMDTQIGEGTTIGAFTVLGADVVIGDNVVIDPFCVLEQCTVESGCHIGPFAHVKAKSIIHKNAVIGNFVEVKKSEIGEKTKIKHLSYIGDACLGKNVNVGAGTVICNYDGFKKHQTFIKDGAKVGANTSLVAPLTVEKFAFIGAGSVITQDVPENSLALGRARQINKSDWVTQRFQKQEKEKEGKKEDSP
jgi:bifunctional UDP-N-acetylglucosamine pyrophosphorylase/glucosamine-1-phosphate N-acetyltransferase